MKFKLKNGHIKRTKAQHTVIHIFFDQRNPATPQSSLSASSNQLTPPIVSNQPHFTSVLLFSLNKECLA
jgi:hypothetical protein